MVNIFIQDCYVRNDSNIEKMLTIKKVIIIIAFLFVIIIFIASIGETKKEDKPTIAYPQNEITFIDANNNAMQQAEKAENDMQKDKALNERNKIICANMGKLSVDDWVGGITDIESNSDGHGVLEIKISETIYIKT